jgi:hypothetical protein
MIRFFSFITCSLLFILGSVFAQEYDYKDVPQGLETLNIAIEEDTTETGEPQSYMRVYRLERGGYYLMNGTIRSNGDAPLRIFAAEGDGPMPVIIPAVDETGSSGRFSRPDTDTEFRGIYISGIDNLGNQSQSNMFRMEGDGMKLVLDNVFADHDAQSFVRMNNDNQKLIIKNSTMRNSFLLSDPGNGRFADTRGNFQDTIMFVNSTFYVNSNRPIRTSGNPFENLIIDHCTFYQITGQSAITGVTDNDDEGEFDVRTVRHAKITNSLFINHQFEGDENPTNLDPGEIDYPNPMFGIDTLGTIVTDTVIVGQDTTIVDSVIIDFDRSFIIKNNYYGNSDDLKAYFAEWGDTVVEGEFIPEHQLTMWFDNEDYPQFMQENNVEHYVQFDDPPSNDNIIIYARHRRSTGFSNVDNPNPAADRNGIAAIEDDPASFGPAEDEYDFSYSTSDPAYTAAEGGFPLGDLNWFPDKLAEWLVTDIEENVTEVIPSGYSLEQNYPNPFNPTTNIKFSLPEKSELSLTIYNLVGQEVVKLVNNELLNAGSYTAQWDGRNSYGTKVASGIYIYELSAGKVNIANKMILMK